MREVRVSIKSVLDYRNTKLVDFTKLVFPESLTTLFLEGHLGGANRENDVAILNQLMGKVPNLEKLNMLSSEFRFKSDDEGIELPATLKTLCANGNLDHIKKKYNKLEAVTSEDYYRQGQGTFTNCPKVKWTFRDF